MKLWNETFIGCVNNKPEPARIIFLHIVVLNCFFSFSLWVLLKILVLLQNAESDIDLEKQFKDTWSTCDRAFSTVINGLELILVVAGVLNRPLNRLRLPFPTSKWKRLLAYSNTKDVVFLLLIHFLLDLLQIKPIFQQNKLTRTLCKTTRKQFGFITLRPK